MNILLYSEPCSKEHFSAGEKLRNSSAVTFNQKKKSKDFNHPK